VSSIVQTLRRVIHPDAVAVIGASGDSAKYGGRVMQFLVKHGYAGRIVPVNPNARPILGLTTYASIADAPGPIDVALLAAPAQHLPATLEECGKAGVACCVIITADFAESGEAGRAREEALVAIARRHGMRLIGPNCLGYVSPHVKLALTSSMALAVEPLPRGAIALVSQSGSMMASMLSRAADYGAGFSACVSVGNQADLELCDFVEYFIEDEATRAICLYVEGLKDGRRFIDLANRCRAAGKPLLALKAGGSDAGASMTQSHTASLAGSHEVWRAVCRAHGVLMMDDAESMIDCAQFLTRFGGARSPGIAALSPSGGTIAVTADRLAAAGLTLAQPSTATRQSLADLVPASRPLNPLDVGGLSRETGVTGAIAAYEAFARDPSIGAVLIIVATTPQLEEKVRRWGEAALAAGKPTAILFTPGSLVDGARGKLREIGCPYTNRMDDALRVLRAAVEYGAVGADRRTQSHPPEDFVRSIENALRALPDGRLTEPQAKSLLRAAGVATADPRVVASADAALEAAADIGYPVVLKGICREVSHKSDAGLVRLDLADSAAVHTAWREIEANLAKHLSGERLEGCLVERYLSDGVEVIVGAKHDPQFGPIVMVGAGGVLVEIMNDTTLAPAPVTREAARLMVAELRMWPLLNGARGRRPCNVDALLDAIVRVSWLAATLGSRLVELDVNPLLVRTSDAVALDGRATLRPTLRL